MAWKAVGPVVQKVVSRIVDVGDGGAATPSVSRKSAESTRLPASATGQRRREGETRMVTTANRDQEEFPALLVVSRHRRVTSNNGWPRPVARLCLVIDNEGGGGRLEEGGPCVRRLRRNSWSDRARELGIRVVG